MNFAIQLPAEALIYFLLAATPLFLT